MKTKILFGIMLLALSAPTVAVANEMSQPQEKSVYICTGPSAKRYHAKKSCTGLKNCSGAVQQISLQKAKSMGRTPCKRCY